jgi:hypothetical protein
MFLVDYEHPQKDVQVTADNKSHVFNSISKYFFITFV